MESEDIELQSQLEVLEKVPYLQNLDEEMRTALCMIMEKTQYETGDTIVKQGDEANSFFILLSGRAEAWITGEQGDKLVRSYESGDFFGERALLNEGVRAATVKSSGSTGCSLLCLTSLDFHNNVPDTVKDGLRKMEYAKYEEL